MLHLRLEKLIFLSICFFNIINSSFAQNDNKADSLLAVYQSDAHDTFRIDALEKLAWHYSQSDLDKSIAYALELIPLSQRLKDKETEGDGNRITALAYERKESDLDTILPYYERSLELYTAINLQKKIGAVYSDMASSHYRFGQNDVAFSLFQKGLEIAEKIDNSSLAVRCLNNMALVFDDKGDQKNALKYYSQALTYAREMDNKRYIAALTNNIGAIYDLLEQHDTALIFFREALELKRTFNNQRSLVTTLCNIGRIQAEEEKYEDATQLASEALEIATKSNYKYGVGLSSSLFAEIAFFQKNYTQSRDYAKKGLQALNGESFPIIRLDLLEFLKDSHFQLANYQAAFKAQSEYHQLADSIYTLESDQQIDELHTQYNVKQKDLENELLKAESEITNKTLRSRTAMALAIILLLGGWSLFTYRNNQQRKTQNELLAKDLENKRTIEAQAEKLQTLYDYKNKLFANIAHELRTPLTLIANPVKSALGSQKIEDNHRKNLLIADKNIRSLSSTVYQILDLAKRESVELVAQPIDFDVNALIRFVANDFRSTAQFKAIQLTQPSSQLPIPVVTDGEKLMIVLRNLLSNAFKFTPKNGQVSINVSDLEDSIIINVEDTGRGISEKDLEKIFDRHFQVSPEHLPNEGGMGIGLAICKEYMSLLKGTITAKSQVGTGSTFTIRFPKQLNATQTIPENPTSDFNALLHQYHITETIADTPIATTEAITKENLDEISTILIVEDNVDMSSYLNRILSEEHEVFSVQDGQQALLFLENQLPDLIISDYMMPNMDGLTFLNTIKNNAQYTSIPVIMLTAQHALDIKLDALRIGIDDYLTKPFDHRELMARVNNILTNQRIIKVEKTSSQNEERIFEIEPTMNLEDRAWLAELESTTLKYIYNLDFTIHQLADAMAISYSHFFPKIKQLTGMTPHQYIRELRFQEARKLLEARKYGSVKAVAYSVGYKSVKYFSKNFKKRFGKYPSEYLI